MNGELLKKDETANALSTQSNISAYSEENIKRLVDCYFCVGHEGCAEDTLKVENKIFTGGAPPGPHLIVQASLFEGESLEVRLNDSIVYTKSITPGNHIGFIARLPLPPQKISKVGLRTVYRNKVYIDTAIPVGVYSRFESLKVVISAPLPYDYQKYMKDGIPTGNWGVLGIDSSLRSVWLRIE